MTKLLASYGNGSSAAVEGMRYGISIDISGKYAIVGADSDNYDSTGSNAIQWAGSAFILFNDGGTWKPVRKLSSPARNLWAAFGSSVAISGDYAVVGERGNPGELSAGSMVGAAYVFKKDEGGPDNWGLVKKITARVRNASDNFGSAVDISGNYIVVATRWDDLDANDQNPLTDAGAAFIFEKDNGGTDNWGLVKKITATVRRAGQNFGTSAAIDGDHIVVGAHAEQRDASELSPLGYAGAAYLFKKDQGGANNWGLVKKITSAIRASNDNFGCDVDISGNNLIVGALFEAQDASELNTLSNAGAAYIFSKDLGGNDNWGQAKKLTAIHRQQDGWFGSYVAISGNVAAASSYYETLDKTGNNYLNASGSVYLFEKGNTPGTEWNKATKLVLSQRVSNDQFGFGIGLDGKYLLGMSNGLAQEPTDNSSVNNPGAVYVFEQEPPLPVTLASFKVSKVENQAFLQWTTTAETNTSHFEIQKSLNAKDWATIGTREAAKESNALLKYMYWDSQLTDGNVYYRLKMVDQDGTFAYSSIRNLLGKNGATLVAFPNPAVDRIFVEAADFDQIASVEIRNATGQLVYETSQIDGEGIAVGKFGPGTYIVQIRDADGISVTRKITISR